MVKILKFTLIVACSWANGTVPVRKPLLGNAGRGRRALFCSHPVSRRKWRRLEDRQDQQRSYWPILMQFAIWFLWARYTAKANFFLSGVLCRFFRNTYRWRSNTALLSHGKLTLPVEFGISCHALQFPQLRAPCSSRWLSQTLPSLPSLTHGSYLVKWKPAHLSCDF